MGYIKQCSRIPEAAPAIMCVPTVLDGGKLSYSSASIEKCCRASKWNSDYKCICNSQHGSDNATTILHTVQNAEYSTTDILYAWLHELLKNTANMEWMLQWVGVTMNSTTRSWGNMTSGLRSWLCRSRLVLSPWQTHEKLVRETHTRNLHETNTLCLMRDTRTRNILL